MHLIPPSADLAIEALYDCWAFFQLIKYHGGIDGWDQCHYDFLLMLQAPQLYRSGRLTGDVLRRWKYCNKYEPGVLQLPYNNRMLKMPRGHFKAQPLTSRVLTPTGWTTIGDLKVGDLVIGRGGLPKKVLALHPISEMEVYQVETKDGRISHCNGDHLWSVHIPSNYRDNKAVVINTRELRNLTGKRNGATFYENRAYIKPVTVVGEHIEDLNISPYTLGYWLGDGTSSTGDITTNDPEVLGYLDRVATKSKAPYRYNLSGLVTELRDAGLLNNKHIPSIMFSASVEQRLELLQGLMDSDGSCHRDGKVATFAQKSKELTEDFVSLVRSLGGMATVCTNTSYQFSPEGVDYYYVNVKLPPGMCPFKLKRKASKWKGSVDLRCYVTCVEPDSVVKARCITVEDELYMTDDYLITHNSSLVMGYIMWRIYRNANIRMLHATNVLDLSQAFVRELRAYFEDEELQATVWNNRPHIRGRLIPVLDAARRRSMTTESLDTKVVWNNEMLQVIRGLKAKEPTFASTSVGAKSTGQHYDIVFMDDTVDFDNAGSETKIKKMKRWAGDIVSVINKVTKNDRAGVLPDGTEFFDLLGDERVVTGTHYDPQDYYATTELSAKLGKLKYNVFERNIYANDIDHTDGYILTGFNRERELELREELSELPGVFDAQYLNKVHSEELQVLSTLSFHWYQEAEFIEGKSDGLIYFKLDNDNSYDCIKPIIALDPAISLKSRADDTAIVVGGVSLHGRLVIVDTLVGHFTPERTCEEFVRLIKKWGVKLTYVETVGFQALLRKMLVKAVSEAKVECGILDYLPKGNKQKRIEYHLHPYTSKGKLVAASHLKFNQRFVNPIDFFGKATSRDDVPDAMSVVAEKSFPPEPKQARVRRGDPFWSKQANQYNQQYGGIF